MDGYSLVDRGARIRARMHLKTVALAFKDSDPLHSTLVDPTADETLIAVALILRP